MRLRVEVIFILTCLYESNHYFRPVQAGTDKLIQLPRFKPTEAPPTEANSITDQPPAQHFHQEQRAPPSSYERPQRKKPPVLKTVFVDDSEDDRSFHDPITGSKHIILSAHYDNDQTDLNTLTGKSSSDQDKIYESSSDEEPSNADEEVEDDGGGEEYANNVQNQGTENSTEEHVTEPSTHKPLIEQNDVPKKNDALNSTGGEEKKNIVGEANNNNSWVIQEDQKLTKTEDDASIANDSQTDLSPHEEKELPSQSSKDLYNLKNEDVTRSENQSMAAEQGDKVDHSAVLKASNETDEVSTIKDAATQVNLSSHSKTIDAGKLSQNSSDSENYQSIINLSIINTTLSNSASLTNDTGHQVVLDKQSIDSNKSAENNGTAASVDEQTPKDIPGPGQFDNSRDTHPVVNTEDVDYKMLVYTIYCIAIVSIIMVLRWMRCESVSIGRNLQQVLSQETSKVNDKREQLYEKKRELGLNMDTNLHDHLERLNDYNRKLTEGLNRQNRLAPIKESLDQLRAELGPDIVDRISIRRNYYQNLKAIRSIIKVNTELKKKVRQTKYDKLMMIQNLVDLDDLSDILSCIEFNEEFKSLEETSFRLRCEKAVFRDQLDILRSVGRQLDAEHSHLMNEVSYHKKRQAELKIELLKVLDLCDPNKFQETIDNWEKKIKDKVEETERYYKKYIENYYKCMGDIHNEIQDDDGICDVGMLQ